MYIPVHLLSSFVLIDSPTLWHCPIYLDFIHQIYFQLITHLIWCDSLYHFDVLVVGDKIFKKKAIKYYYFVLHADISECIVVVIGKAQNKEKDYSN